jgi:hypothetical protein
VNIRNSVTFGPGEAGESVIDSRGGRDIAVARYGASGDLDWAIQAGGTSDDSIYGLSAFSDASFVVTGHFRGDATFETTTLSSSGDCDGYVARYGPTGHLQWITQMECPTGFTSGHTVTAVDADGSVLVSVTFDDTVTLAPGEPEERSFSSRGDRDVLLVRYDGMGRLVSATQIGGSVGSEIGIHTALRDGTPIACGQYEGAMTFFPGEPEETTLPFGGSVADAYIARLAP